MTSRDRKLNLTHVSIKGYRSIQSLDRLPLGDINILIGANGAGKSNFIEFVKEYSKTAVLFLNILTDRNYQIVPSVYDIRNSNAFTFFKGIKDSDIFEVCLEFPVGKFRTVVPRHTSVGEVIDIDIKGIKFCVERILNSSGKLVNNLTQEFDKSPSDAFTAKATLLKSLAESMVYNFHNIRDRFSPTEGTTDQSETALAADGANIAWFLQRIKQEHELRYEKILGIIQMAAPFFDDFIFAPDEDVNAQFLWRQKGVDGTFHPLQLSESTLRFICLTTALLQPNPPIMMVFDEPELGLHPLAVHLLSELIHMASDDAQIIAATQSPMLVDYFEPDDIIVVERVDGASRFKRLCNKELEPWLEKYSLGELWRKNSIGGGPWGA